MDSISILLLRRPQVQMRTGLARSTLYRLIALGQFPPPVKIAGRAVAWPLSDVEHWILTRTIKSGAGV
jgi:prophage regulatory protein